MIERFDWDVVESRGIALARPRGRDDAALLDGVREIVANIRTCGWPALVEQAIRIDRAPPELIAVAPFAAEARRTFPRASLDALDLARRNIEAFHLQTRPRDIEVITMPGLSVAKEWRALGSAGLYIPGGKAPLFSTLLMLAIPARVAGVERLTLVTPPRPGGGRLPSQCSSLRFLPRFPPRNRCPGSKPDVKEIG